MFNGSGPSVTCQLKEENGIDYISKLRSLLENKKEFSHQDLNQVFDKLNQINWNVASFEEKCMCIRVCCSSSLPTNSVLIGKCSQVLVKIVQNAELSEQVVLLVARWCMQFLTKSPDISQTEVFDVVECLLKNNADHCKRVVDDILRILKEPLENRTKLVNPGEILLQRLKCIRALSPLINSSHINIVKEVLVELTQKHVNADKSVKSEIIFKQLEILSVLCEKNASWLIDNIGVILGISLSFASYGLPHHIESIPQYLLPTSLLFPDSKSNVSKNVNKNKNRRKQKKNIADRIKATPLDDIIIPDLNWSQTSDSDFSDSEMGKNLHIMKSERKIRCSALSLLLYIVRTVGKQELIGYWNNILDGPYSILKTLSNDTSARSRVAILSILSILFSTSKTYLLQAQHAPKRHQPYISWSHLLADLISSVHNVLCDVIKQAQSVGATLSILQCLVIFLRNTPYHRLNDGLLRNVVQSINPLLKHADCNIRLSAIKCLNEVVIFEPNTEEQILLMRFKDDNESGRNTAGYWLVSYCLESIENEKLAIIVRAEAWFLLGNLLKHHFINIDCASRLPKIVSLLLRDLQDSNIVIQQKAAKAFEQIAVPVGSLDTTCRIDCYEMWLSILQGPLVPMLQSASGILASAAADCIANITTSVFEQLPERLRIFVMTALCGCVGHEEHIARSAAVRTLGTIVVFPFLSEDIQIIYDVADRIVTAMKDDNLSVRTKAAWALGNLSDVLLSGRKIGVPIEEVSLSNLIEQAVRTGHDHEKVKACSMRAIGNLFLLVEEHHIQTEKFQSLVLDASVALIYNSSNENNMKVRWNACYSLGNMFKNPLLRHHVAVDWMSNALEIISKLIVTCSNFKVRQASCTALCSISTKEFYGELYLKLWPCLMQAFENSQNLTEFSEYKHQRNLVDQLCLTLCHLSHFLHIEDIDTVREVIPPYIEPCKKYIVELKRRHNEVEEKFKMSETHLDSLLRCNLKAQQRETIISLKGVLQAKETPSS